MTVLRIISITAFIVLIVQYGLLTIPLESSTSRVLKVEIRGPIQPSTASYLERVIEKADGTGSSAVLIELDTPGGMLGPTRKIVTTMMASKTPIITHVTPSGARAGSAGTFIVAASHIAAMSPATNIGAATPVGASGEDLGETMESKASQDAAALLRSIAKERGRDSEALESTIFRSASFTSEEALTAGMIDLISDNTSTLLQDVDGLKVTTSSGSVTIQTLQIPVVEFERTMLEKFLDAMGNPNITFILLTIGSIALTLEFLQPGIMVGAFVGILAMGLAFVGLGQLPVNWLGIGLLAGAVILFFVEAQAPGIGLYMAGGLICFVLGAFLLFGGLSTPPLHGSAFAVSTWVIGSASAILAGSLLLALKAFAEAAGKGMPSHASGIVGSEGVARTNLDPLGSVQVESELWSAEASEEGIRIVAGERVIVNRIDGLTVFVSRIGEGKKSSDKEETKT